MNFDYLKDELKNIKEEQSFQMSVYSKIAESLGIDLAAVVEECKKKPRKKRNMYQAYSHPKNEPETKPVQTEKVFIGNGHTVYTKENSNSIITPNGTAIIRNTSSPVIERNGSGVYSNK